MRNALSILVLSFLFACPKRTETQADRADPPPPPAATDRVPAVAKDHPLYARVEGTSFANDCTGDDGCMMGGCSSEVCAAEQVTTTCEMPAEGFPKGDGCGCVGGQCVWYDAQRSNDTETATTAP
jgi:eight-cysteine-cluster-containing protein